MNRKTTFLIAAISFAGLITTAAQANETSSTVVQTMEPIVIKASLLPSASAVKLERIVVTARGDLSDIQPEPLARGESKTSEFSAPASL